MYLFLFYFGFASMVPGSLVSQANDCPYFIVDWPDKQTLNPIIKKNCELKSVMDFDEWVAYTVAA